MKKVVRIWSLSIMAAGTVLAQDFPRFAFNIGGGFTQPVYEAGDRLDRGWNIGAGAGVSLHPNFSLMLDFTHQRMGINSTTLTSLGFPDGDVRLSSFTLNPVIHTNPRGPVDVYFTGGGGLYHWYHQFTRPATATFTGFDPYFGVFYPVAVPVNEVLASYSVNKPGFNGGMGVAFGTRWKAEFYAEARFHRMIFGNDRHVDTVPVTFGFRW